jgi:hypothetical protein
MKATLGEKRSDMGGHILDETGCIPGQAREIRRTGRDRKRCSHTGGARFRCRQTHRARDDDNRDTYGRSAQYALYDFAAQRLRVKCTFPRQNQIGRFC